jgi:hypothetical protein
MSTQVSKHGFSPMKVMCPVCESIPFVPCKENGRAVIHPFKPQFHAEREAVHVAEQERIAAELAAKEETAKFNEAERLAKQAGDLPTLEEFIAAGYEKALYPEFIRKHIEEKNGPDTQPPV